MQYLTGVYWNCGSAAACNQDSLMMQQVLTRRGRVFMAAVCDGMGGLQEGETASGYLTERLQEWFYESFIRAVRKKKPFWVIRRSLDRTVYHAQEQLRQYGRREQLALGTTMSVLVLWENTYLIWHLGDSRIYRIGRNSGKRGAGRKGGRRTSAQRMTEDHVKGRNRLTKCVGCFGYYRPDYRMGTAKAGEAFLLCSDGFYRCVEENELAEVLCPGQIQEEEQAERRLKEIGEACMKRGEKDNLTAVYVKLCGGK